SVVLVTAAGDREVFPAFLYVYVGDADAVYARALAAGATSLEEPFDTPYGDRRAMVRDPFGNVWQIGHVVRPGGRRARPRPRRVEGRPRRTGCRPRRGRRRSRRPELVAARYLKGSAFSVRRSSPLPVRPV